MDLRYVDRPRRTLWRFGGPECERAPPPDRRGVENAQVRCSLFGSPRRPSAEP